MDRISRRSTIALICLALGLYFGTALCATAQDAWIAYPGPAGGSVNFIRMWSDTGVACGGADYRTLDDGTTWHENMVWSATSVAVDSGGLGWMSFTTTPSWTTDYGANWYDFPANAPLYKNVEQFLTAPGGKHYAVRATTPWVASAHLVYESINPAPNTWVAKKTIGLPASFHFNEMAVNGKTGSLFLSSVDASGIRTTMYRSTDEGDHWEQLPLTGIPSSESPIWGYNTLVAMTDGTLFYDTHHSVGNVWQWNNYRSTDDGTTWHPCGAGLPAYAALWSPVQNVAGTIFCTALIENQQGASHWTSVYQSTDGGLTFAEPANAGLPPKWAMQITITPRGTLLTHALTGQGGGVYRSTDNGATWTLAVLGLWGITAVSVAVDSSANMYVCAPESGVYRSKTGFSWTRLTSGIPTFGYLHLRPAPDKSIYAADTIGGVFHSTDLGNTWATVSSNLPSLHMLAFEITPRGTLMAFTDNGTYRSTNAGSDWALAAGTIPPGVLVRNAAVRGDGLMVATSPDGPYISNDDGNHWSLQTAGLTVPACRGVTFTKSGTVLMGNSGGVERSSDGGVHWARSDNGVLHGVGDNDDFTAFAVRASGRIIGSRSGDNVFIYASTDDGLTWTDGRTGNLANFTNFQIPEITVDGKNNIYIASDDGVWHAAPEVVGVAESRALAPEHLSVIASPDPASAETTIAFELPRAGVVSLSMVDALGREVYNTEPAWFGAGSRWMPVNTTSLSTGMYHCVVRGAGAQGTVTVGVVR